MVTAYLILFGVGCFIIGFMVALALISLCHAAADRNNE